MKRSYVALRLVQALAYLLVCRTTVLVVLNYGDYFPPNFRSDFLTGRESYFYGPYQWAFYVHVLVGPFALIAGMTLLSNRLRRRFPAAHRRLGKFQIACVLFLLAPSGLWMARYAVTGAVAATGFACLALATAFSAAAGWRAAIQRRFDDHRRWMLRCFVLLCSTVVVRVVGGASEVLGVEGTYAMTAWLSWLVPLFVLESLQFNLPAFRRQRSSASHGGHPSLGSTVAPRHGHRDMPLR